ncbi:MAG: NAD(P)/FAD-dependent oxidoreductase, partial [Bacteroidota bacterium]
NNGKLRKRNFVSNFYSEYKFKSSTWFDFLEQYIAPSVLPNLNLNEPISAIDYSGTKVRLSTTNGRNYEADKVIITVPLTILQQNLISFTPSLPTERKEALTEVDMPAGLKVFIEFSERFYPDMVLATGLGGYLFGNEGDKLYYDAAFKKDSDKNVLGLFTVGEITEQYANMSNEEIIQSVMQELDEMFKGKASQFYKQHVVQHWTQEPYIRGSYSFYNSNQAKDILSEPIQEKLYFAGEAFAPVDTSTVHGAAQSAYTATELIMNGN